MLALEGKTDGTQPKMAGVHRQANLVSAPEGPGALGLGGYRKECPGSDGCNL
jgi:hypothetical protein